MKKHPLSFVHLLTRVSLAPLEYERGAETEELALPHHSPP